MGFRVTHLYGLTESYGPATLCAVAAGMARRCRSPERARRMARQGVPMPTLSQFQVGDPGDRRAGAARRRDARRGDASRQHDHEGLSRQSEGDRGGVRQAAGIARATSASGIADGYIEIKDRSKDIIISGGENISSLEVEECLYRHPQVMEAAVVARPDDEMGRDAMRVRHAQARRRRHRRRPTSSRGAAQRLAHYKAPRTVVFGPLPKTATGKIQKFVLREAARKLGEGG